MTNLKKIQLITLRSISWTLWPNLTYNNYLEAQSIDEFDINVVDLSCAKLWENHTNSYSSVSEMKNLSSLRVMIENSQKAHVIYVLPQNQLFYANKSPHSIVQSEYIKDILKIVKENIFCKLISSSSTYRSIQYEKTKTYVNEMAYNADFFFSNDSDTITTSKESNKITTTKYSDRFWVTTLNIFENERMFRNYLNFIFGDKKEDTPEWMKGIEFCDDAVQRRVISENEEIIKKANENIDIANKKLSENAEYKSILFTNSTELVQVVFRILEQLLDCDLSKFVDERKEDFLIKNEDCTFIGEIKGVTSNVRFEHVSQLELHARTYLDKLADEDKTETVKQLLIINPQRNTPVYERKPINDDQINLALRNNCLIIETFTLLKLFEKFKAGKIDAFLCNEIFRLKIGLLTENDFSFND